jgi:SAM-dependent methyltransferase
LSGFESIKIFLDSVDVIEDQVDNELLLDQGQPELVSYRQFHAKRFWQSAELIKKHIRTKNSLRILELGAMPYYFTAILLQYLNCERVEGANIRQGIWPAETSVQSPPRVVRLSYGEGEQTKDVQVHILNLERDDFPFQDSSFDLVVCMDLIEHLIYSPTHMLAEAHRVLKPRGKLFLTTPNGINMHKTLALLFNRSIGFPYSGYSIYGRHNREFSMKELIDLLEKCGYDIVDAQHRNTTLRNHYPLMQRMLFNTVNFATGLPLPYLQSKREYIFITAENVGQPQYAFPENLYIYPKLYRPNSEETGRDT